MANDGSIGVKLKAEGEATFKKALSDLNAQFKLVKSERNLVSSEYDQNDRVSWVLSRNEDRTLALDFRIRYLR